MSVIDNTLVIRPFIKDSLDYCVVQSYIPALIVTRAKDGNDNYTIWEGTIRGSKHFEKLWPYLKGICDSCNGRLYISPAVRTFENYYKQLQLDMAQHMMSDTYQDPKRLYAGALFTAKPNVKKWVLDIDSEPELIWALENFKTGVICTTRQGYNIVIDPCDTRGIDFEAHSTTLMKHGNILVYANLKSV